MRDELHLLELADRYLEGTMSADERTAFEVRIAGSQELRDVVSDQRALREGIARVHVRAAATKAYTSYRFGKWWPWAAGGLAVVGIGAALWLSSQHEPIRDPRMVSTSVEVSMQVDTLVATAYPDPPMDESGNVLPGPDVAIDTIIDTVYVATVNGKRVSWDSIPKGALLKEVRDAKTSTEPIAEGKDDPMRALTKEEIVQRLDSVTALGQPATSASTTTEPMFKGGWDAMHRYLQQNIRPVKESNEGGTVIVDFLVDELGRISDVQVKESLSEPHDKEAVRVIKAMPKWLPCKNNGKPARCRMTVPLRFTVDGN
ncbi:MAG: TonB family protein [Flavobacteriales bacterium]